MFWGGRGILGFNERRERRYRSFRCLGLLPRLMLIVVDGMEIWQDVGKVGSWDLGSI